MGKETTHLRRYPIKIMRYRIINFLLEGEPIKDDKAKKVLSTYSLYLIIAQDHQVLLVQTGHMVQSRKLEEIYADRSTKTKHYTY